MAHIQKSLLDLRKRPTKMMRIVNQDRAKMEVRTGRLPKSGQ
jgi:hypothetical protein